MDQETIFLTILGMGVVTYLPRFLPAWLLSARPPAPGLVKWLSFVPAAVLSAMLLPALMIEEDCLNLTSENLYLPAAILVYLIAWKTRSLFAALLTGLALVAGARALWGL